MNIDETDEYEILKAVFDALPSLLFVVDQDVRIQEYNMAASSLLKAERTANLNQRCGDTLYCAHALETQEGCGGSQSCKTCTIRNSVKEAFKGNSIVREHARVELMRDGHAVEIFAFITVSPFVFRKTSHALLVIEDTGDIAALRQIITACSVCRKIRNGEETWTQIEAYFADTWKLDFSHGLCPECFEDEMAKAEEWASLHPAVSRRLPARATDSTLSFTKSTEPVSIMA